MSTSFAPAMGIQSREFVFGSRFLAIVGLVLGASSLSAQTIPGSFDFDANDLGTIGAGNRWIAANNPLYGDAGATLTDTNQQLQFTTGSSSVTNAATLVWIGAGSSGAYDVNWTATVEVTNLMASGYVSAGIEAYTLYDTGSGITNNAYYGIYLNGSGAGTNAVSQWGIWNSGTSNFDRSIINTTDTGSDTTVYLRLRWDAGEQVLRTFGSIDDVNFQLLASYDLVSGQSGIGAPYADGFGIQLVGFSSPVSGTSVAVTAGQVTLDNFVVTAVPEPMASAELLGAASLVGMFFLRRKNKRRA